MKKLFLIPLMLLATLVFTSACSEDDTIQDGQEPVTPGEDDGEEGNEGNNEEGGSVEGGNGRYLVLLLLPNRQYRADGADHPVHIGLRYDSGRA